MYRARAVKNDPDELSSWSRGSPAGSVAEGSFDRVIFVFRRYFHARKFHKIQPGRLDR